MWPYFIVAAIGSVAGVTELISKYNDAPFSALKNAATALVAAVNALASIAALAVIQSSNIVTLPTSIGPGAQTAAQIIVAGIGGMAILRVGISFQVGGHALNISLASLLQPLLRAAGNQIDRARAADKLAVTKELMSGLDTTKALKDLPPLCLFLMQSISQEDQKQLADSVKALKEQDIQSELKLISLGSALLNTVGESVLRSAVAAFRDAQTRALSHASEAPRS